MVYYLNACPDSMGGYPWELIAALAGITDLDTLREVWERFSIVKGIEQEYEAKQKSKRRDTG